MSYMKRYKEMLERGEFPRKHILEPGGRIAINGAGYPVDSMFSNVDIEIKNNKNYPICLELTETGFITTLVSVN